VQRLVRGRAHGLPTPPVARAPPMMCHRDDFDLSVTDPIDQTKRKVRKEIPTRSVHILRPTLRSLSHTFHAGVDFRRKSACGDGTPLRVPLHCGFYLSSGCRVKANLDGWHQYAS
jgi:hypothetical protein